MNCIRLTLIGPLPPPVHGQSVAMRHIVSSFESKFDNVRVINVSEGESSGVRKGLRKITRAVAALRSVLTSDVVYIAVKAGHGMWLTTATAGVARMWGARIFLHHHSYAYVRHRVFRMVALTQVAGASASHIVLSQAMASDLKKTMPELNQLIVVGNAALIDKSLLELPLKESVDELVLGHLSNLTMAKGIAETIDLAVALRDAGVRVRLLIGGPAIDSQAQSQVTRAKRELGDSFEYLGPLARDQKNAFFRKISHFVFPTRYVHEAVPLVLYEALAAGVVCIATRQGSIEEQLWDSRAVLADSATSFVEETLPLLRDLAVSRKGSERARQAFLRALATADEQLESLASRIAAAS